MNIKNKEAYQLTKQLAKLTGESLTTAVAVARKGLVKTLASHARLFREISHAFRPRHDAESMGEERRVIFPGNLACQAFHFCGTSRVREYG